MISAILSTLSAVRFTDLDKRRAPPSSELLGYYHSTAIADWALKDFLCNPDEEANSDSPGFSSVVSAFRA